VRAADQAPALLSQIHGLVMFSDYLERWGLTPDGDPIVTHTSRLLPVRQGGVPAMLKVALHAEEKRGNLLMTWWNGQGAAPVLAHERRCNADGARRGGNLPRRSCPQWP